MSSVPGLMHYIVNLIKLIKAENQKSRIRVHGKNSLKILNDVKENKLRFGLIWIYDELIIKNKEMVFDSFQEVKIIVCVSKNHILVECKQLTIDDLKNETFVVHDEQYLKWYYELFIVLFVGCVRNENLPLSEADKIYINELKNEFERRCNL
ncbi:hypothetical protein V5E38_03400 [Rossellomorea sp. GAMAL-10_SWC]